MVTDSVSPLLKGNVYLAAIGTLELSFVTALTQCAVRSSARNNELVGLAKLPGITWLVLRRKHVTCVAYADGPGSIAAGRNRDTTGWARTPVRLTYMQLAVRGGDILARWYGIARAARKHKR